jgi:hypothetical protein
MDKVKPQCDRVAWGLINELEWCFLEHQGMTMLGVVYPQFWAKNPKDVEK